MAVQKFGKRVVVLGLVLLGAQFGAHGAMAARHASGHSAGRAIYAGVRHARASAHSGHYRHYGALQCVPFARENTGIELSGNAANWWAAAAGVYERGARPEVGSVLNFRATGRMRMGHVAVVSNVVDGRTVQIDQANWGGPGSVSRDVEVVDVSPSNDWTQVRVERGHTGGLGSVYPTFGFIYDRPDRGTMVANAGVTPSAPVQEQEVAEAPDDEPLVTGGSYRRHARRSRLVAHRAFFGHASVYRVQTRISPDRHRRHRL